MDFTVRVTPEERLEISRRLFAYLLFPPPTLARPGGRSSAKAKEVSAIEGASALENSAKEIKRGKLSASEDDRYEQLQTFIALELARRLKSLEDAGLHRQADASEYTAAAHDFRIIGGFGRLLGSAGRMLAPPGIAIATWKEWWAAYRVYDLVARLKDSGLAHSETMARLVVLLRQDKLGISISHAKLSQVCKHYRSIAHLLVAILDAQSDRANKQFRVPRKWFHTSPSLTELTAKVAERLDEVLLQAVNLGRLYSAGHISRRGGPIIRPVYQLRLPDDLKLNPVQWKARPLNDEELRTIEAVVWERKEKRGARKGERLEIFQVTSKSCKKEREALLKRYADAKCSNSNHQKKRNTPALP